MGDSKEQGREFSARVERHLIALAAVLTTVDVAHELGVAPIAVIIGGYLGGMWLLSRKERRD